MDHVGSSPVVASWMGGSIVIPLQSNGLPTGVDSTGGSRTIPVKSNWPPSGDGSPGGSKVTLLQSISPVVEPKRNIKAKKDCIFQYNGSTEIHKNGRSGNNGAIAGVRGCMFMQIVEGNVQDAVSHQGARRSISDGNFELTASGDSLLLTFWCVLEKQGGIVLGVKSVARFA